MANECVGDLLRAMDDAAEWSEFPGWECGFENAVVGAMRATGFTTDDGVALVFEDFEYSTKEALLQSVAYCIATVPVSTPIQVGEAATLDLVPWVEADEPPETESVDVESRGTSFPVAFDRDRLTDVGALEAVTDRMTAEGLLVSTVEQVPRDHLFSEPAFLRDAFDLGASAEQVFVVDAWEHPSFEALYGGGVVPSDAPDLVAMAEAVCANEADPDLPGDPNTTWQAQCG